MGAYFDIIGRFSPQATVHALLCGEVEYYKHFLDYLDKVKQGPAFFKNSAWSLYLCFKFDII